MTVDPIIVAAAIALLSGMAGLLLLMYRAFMSGDLHPRGTVPRESFDRLTAVNEMYASKFAEQTEAIKALTAVVVKLVPPSSPPPARRSRSTK